MQISLEMLPTENEYFTAKEIVLVHMNQYFTTSKL